MEVALSDGTYTKEEEKILTNAIIDIEKYTEALEIALQDGIIDKQEKNVLFEGRMDIVEKAYKTAREDLMISEDEMEILKTICKVIMDIEKEFND